MELYLPPVFNNKLKRAPRPKINWTEEMLNCLQEKFPLTFNRDLAKELGISMTNLIVKARSMGIKKEDRFLENRRAKITALATEALKKTPHPGRGIKGWCVPNSEKSRFKYGNISIMAIDRSVVEKVRQKRLDTIKRERLRLKIGLKPLTKLKLSV